MVERSVAAHCKDDSFDGCGRVSERRHRQQHGGRDDEPHGPRAGQGIFHRLREQRVQRTGIRRDRGPEVSGASITPTWYGADDCFEALPHMMRFFDEPFGNSSAIPTYFCARLAAQNGVKVLLAGDGGDELFGGNERVPDRQDFRALSERSRLSAQGADRAGAARACRCESGIVGKARRYVRRSNMPRVERMLVVPLSLRASSRRRSLTRISWRHWRDIRFSTVLGRHLLRRRRPAIIWTACFTWT